MREQVKRFAYLLLSFVFLATTMLGFSAPAAATSTEVQLSSLTAGNTVNFAGYTWIVLNPGTGYLLMNNAYGSYQQFDPDSTNVFDPTDTNNIAYYLNSPNDSGGFYNYVLNSYPQDAKLIQSHSWSTGNETDESSSSIDCKIGLISYSENNTYKSSITNLSSATWWTRTPYSGNGYDVWYVNSLGDLMSSASANMSSAVRPALYLDPDILVSGGSGGTVTDTNPPTPTITPDGGVSLTTAQTVTIGNIAAGDKAYYTTDGSTPKSVASATYYNAPFTVDQTETVQVAVYDAVYGWSGESSDTFNFFLTNTAVTGTTASFSFTAPAGATSVELDQSTDGGTTWTAASTGTLSASSTSATATGLSPETPYAFQLVWTGGTYTIPSNVVDVTTTAIEDLKNTAVTGTTASFSFTAPTGATSVALEQSTDSGTTWTTANTGTLSAGSTSATATSLEGGTTYEFKLAVAGGAYAGDSNVVTVTTPMPAFSGGNGTSTDPYKIASAQDLNSIHSVETKPFYYLLTENVSLSTFGSSYANETNSGQSITGWDPIGDGTNNNNYFEGHFDGGGHTISGLYIDDSAGNLYNTGLFGAIASGASVENVNLEGVDISSACPEGNIGALAGWNMGTVSDCDAVGSVTGSREYTDVGGLVGYNDGEDGTASIGNSYATGSVSGSGYDDLNGGLVGYNNGDSGTIASITDCYATGSVTGNGGSDYDGGLVGYNDGDSAKASISDCYATGSVSGSVYGGLAGYNTNDGGTATIDSSYWDTTTTEQTTASGSGSNSSASDSNGKQDPLMKEQSTFVTWNFTNTWGINTGINNGYPYLLPAVNVSANPSSGGTVNGGGNYAVGDTVKVTGAPNSGYTFVSWTDGNGSVVSTDNPYTFSMPDSSVTLTADFAPAPAGTISVGTQTGTLTAGTVGSAALTATTADIPDNTPVTINWCDSNGAAAATPAGLTATATDVSNNASTITVTSTASAAAGTYYFTATCGTAASEVATLTVQAASGYTSSGGGGGSPPALAITATSLPAATVGQPYSQTITTNGEGTAPYTFAVTGGSPPPGLALDAATGVVSGTPTTAGTYTFTVTVKDASGNSAIESYSLTVNNAGGSASLSPASGGTVSLGRSASVSIPAGALQGNTNATVAVQAASSPPAAPAGFMVLGQTYEFTVNGQDHYTFNKPVTLTFTLSQVPAGETPSVYYYDDATDQWGDIGGTVSGDTITVMVDHFTEYAVMAQVSTTQIASPTITLTDIAGNWAYASIEKLVSLGAITGYPDGTFRPDNDITRAEFVTVLVKALKLAPKTGPVFVDTEGTWAQSYISTAAADGIVTGFNATHFGPNDLITREQMTAMMVRADKLALVSGPLPFTDADLIAPWAREYVETAVKDGIIHGYPDGTFRPLNHATRAEATTVIAGIV